MEDDFDWHCHECGKLADYRASGKNYCVEHWDEYLKGKKTQCSKKDSQVIQRE